MKLYHFAPAHMVKSILRNGLTLGQLPILDDSGNLVSFIGPRQWLTKDGDWNKQSWATKKLINYDRTAFRLLISIPKANRDILSKAYDIMEHLPEPSRRLITDWEGSENWYLFLGRIPSGWIRRVEVNPGAFFSCY